MGTLRAAARDRDWPGAAALTFADNLRRRRARGASPRVEPPVSYKGRDAACELYGSYGVSARGRPRSGLAGGAWSRSLQARLGRVCSYDLSKSTAAFTSFGTLNPHRAP